MEMDQNDFITIKSENSDVETTQPVLQNQIAPRVRKSTAGKRKIQHDWKDEETKALIAAVEVRPVLWNAGSGEYKYSRLDAWRQVLSELNIQGIDMNEIKTKWLALRATFKTNLGKLREKQSGPDALESQGVSWRYFKPLLFLEVNKGHQSTESVSSIEMAPAATDRPISDELPESPQPVASNAEVGQRHKRRRTQATPASLSGSSTPNVSSVPTTAVSALQTSDPNSTFCEHILAELRTLSENDSRNLRRLLMQVAYNFMDASGTE